MVGLVGHRKEREKHVKDETELTVVVVRGGARKEWANHQQGWKGGCRAQGVGVEGKAGGKS